MIKNEEITFSGYTGPYNQKNPILKDYKITLDVGHVVLSNDEKRRFNHDGIIGLASVSNDLDNYLFISAMLLNGYIKAESYRFNEVYLNPSSEIYQSSITFGFTEMLSDSIYLFTNNTLPDLQLSDITNNIIYHPVLMNIGLSEVDILNYFDISDFERNETAVIDSAVPFLQLPESTLQYFDETFFNDNCISTNSFDEASWGCVGSDYGGLPTIDFRFKEYLKYSVAPVDYMSPPRINVTTREPYWRLGIYNNWKGDYPKNAGLGKIFINKYSLYMHVNRDEGIITVGFKRGVSYNSFSLIIPTIIYYFFVIIVLWSLAIWLSVKKYKRLQEEKDKKDQLLKSGSKFSGIKTVSKTLRKMDFNIHMSAYNKVFERQRANTVTN